MVSLSGPSTQVYFEWLCWCEMLLYIPFCATLGIVLTCSFSLWEGGITILREGCIPAGKVMQIFERVKNRVV